MVDFDSSGPRRVVIACGGTGGHLFPGIAVAQALHARGHEALLLISEKKVDAVASADHPELRFATVPAIAMPPLFSLKAFSFLFRFWQTFRLTKRVVREFSPHAVLGMGGFTSLPPVLVGRGMKARTLIHESNAVPGKANRLTGRFCDTVLLGLADCAAHFPGKACQVVGTPLREAMHVPHTVEEAREFFGLRDDRHTVLVMGGSQGAAGVNAAVLAALPGLDPEWVQFIHLTGEGADGAVRAAFESAGFHAFVAPFHPRLDLAYAVADVCVARSGASSLAELSFFGLPSILIPYPTAADDHQTLNARVYARAGAAVLLAEPEAKAGNLATALNALLDDEAAHTAMSEAMRSLGVATAAEQIVDGLVGAVS
jgi:UDP-N-acetylglucosamine--N-acetylmuramyl-(pentapeptide) pyrophosphoryl-undecaprenol N-acetylglucosamine transferase